MEVVRLARAMSLKFCTYGISCGGAKAAICGNPLSENRNTILSSFAELLSPLIKTNSYYPGPDMGTDDYDLKYIFHSVGKPELTPRRIGLFREGIPIEELFTGYGVSFCMTSLLKLLGCEENYKPRVILEGFGKVGTAIAMSFKDFGFTITGISTLHGAILDENGLDLDKLLKLRKIHGDFLIEHYESKDLIRTSKEKLFDMSSQLKEVDILIPGARPDVINKVNIDKIECKAIVSAANIPYAEGTIDTLEERNIVAVPDFVSNAGEILALSVINNPTNADQIFDHINTKITERTSDLYKTACNSNISMYNQATSQALAILDKWLVKRAKKLNRKSEKQTKS